MPSKKPAPPSTFVSVIRRFWEKVDKRGSDECWRWLGSHNQEGRGQMWVGGEREVDEVHRVSFMIHNGFMPDRWATGNVVHHTCKVIDCVNPAHLQMVPQAANCMELAEPTPAWLNKHKTRCVKGHPFEGANLAITSAGRVCLTCYPQHWRFCVVRRDPPEGVKPRKYTEWVGPFRPDQEAA